MVALGGCMKALLAEGGRESEEAKTISFVPKGKWADCWSISGPTRPLPWPPLPAHSLLSILSGSQCRQPTHF